MGSNSRYERKVQQRGWAVGKAEKGVTEHRVRNLPVEEPERIPKKRVRTEEQKIMRKLSRLTSWINVMESSRIYFYNPKYREERKQQLAKARAERKELAKKLTPDKGV